MRYFLFALSVLVILCFTRIKGNAQPKPHVEFEKTLGDVTFDTFNSCLKTNDGGFLLAGESYAYAGLGESPEILGLSDAWLVKIDRSGNTKWVKRFGGYGEEGFLSIIEAVDGGYILAGESNSPPGGNKTSPLLSNSDYWIIKIDDDGNKLWEKSYGEGVRNNLRSVIKTSDGNYLLAGHSLYNGQTNTDKDWEDYWILKIDAAGNKIWGKTYGGNSNDFLTCTIASSDGGFLLGGSSRSGVSADKSETYFGIEQHLDYWLVKIDKDGIKEWDRTFGGESADEIDVIAEVAGGYLIGGESLSDASGDKTTALNGGNDFWFIGVDYTGTMLWQKGIGGNDSEFLRMMKRTPDGNFILIGGSYSGIGFEKTSASKGGGDIWMVKINDHAEVLWDVSIGADDDDGAYDGVVISDSTFLLAGYSWSDASGDKSANAIGLADGWVVELSMKAFFCPAVALGKDTTLCLGEMLVLHANEQALEYEWNGRKTNSSSFVVEKEGMYTVNVTYTDCTTSASINVDYTASYCRDIIPNIITPNGDDLNETFVIDLPDQWYVTILNRYGETLYENSDYKNDWKANDVPSGVYYYHVMNSQRSREFKGWLQVIR